MRCMRMAHCLGLYEEVRLLWWALVLSCGNFTQLFIFQLVTPTQIISMTALGVTHFDVQSPHNVIAKFFSWMWHQKHMSLYHDSVRRCCTTPKGWDLTGAWKIPSADQNPVIFGKLGSSRPQPYQVQPEPGHGPGTLRNQSPTPSRRRHLKNKKINPAQALATSQMYLLSLVGSYSGLPFYWFFAV